MPKNPRYLYSVYRNVDDSIVALDVTVQEAAKIMGLENQNSIFHILSSYSGSTKAWTVTRETRKKIEEEMNE